MATCFIVAGEVTFLRFRRLFDEEGCLTLWTFPVHRFIRRNKFTFRIVATAIKDSPFAAPLTDIAATASFRAIDADIDRLCVFTLGISGTREEFPAGTTGFDYHRTATFIAGFIGRFLFGGWCVLLC